MINMKKMNKKGFTLVELLAVIVILGILLVIAVPAIGNVMTTSKQKAAKDGALMFAKAIQNCNGLSDGGVCTSTSIASYYDGTISSSACTGNETDTCAYFAVDSTTGNITAFSYVNGKYGVNYTGSEATIDEIKTKISSLKAENFTSGTLLTFN